MSIPERLTTVRRKGSADARTSGMVNPSAFRSSNSSYFLCAGGWVALAASEGRG